MGPDPVWGFCRVEKSRKILHSVVHQLLNNTTLHPRRPESSKPSLWEPVKVKVKVKVTLEQATKAQRGVEV
jgi:hypothetical protein